MIIRLAIALVALFGISVPAFAATLDTTQRLICSSISASECGKSGDCNGGLASEINVPQFFFIDLAKRNVEATRPDGTELDTKFTMTARDNEPIILQGAEDGRGWSATINRETGGLVIAVSGSDVAFSVFGACIQAG